MSSSLTVDEINQIDTELMKFRRMRITGLLEYAQECYGLKIPKMKEFVTQLAKYDFGSNLVNEWSIDGIMKEWTYWAPYLPESLFHDFVLAEIRSMFKIHVAGTSSLSTLDSYIGNKLKKEFDGLPANMFTTVNIDGICLVNGKRLDK